MVIIKWILGKSKPWLNFHQNTFFTQENSYEYVIRKIAAILFRPVNYDSNDDDNDNNSDDDDDDDYDHDWHLFYVCGSLRYRGDQGPVN